MTHDTVTHILCNMKNITLAVDDATLKAARKYAAERETTVNALVRDYLQKLVGQKTRAAKARDELVRMSEDTKGQAGSGWTWDRDDLYDRQSLPRHQRSVLRGDGPRRGRAKKSAGG